MKKMRIPLLVAWGIAVFGIVMGSFFDLAVSTAIASPTNAFGLAISAIGPTLGFAGVAAMGGGFIVFALKGKYHIVLKVLFFVLAACCFGVSIYYPAGEYFGINGFYGAAPKWVGYLIVLLPEAAAGVGGYFLFKDCKNPNMWIVFCIIIALLCIALLAGIPILKDIMHRPRYRLVSTTDVAFHNWWEPCPEYKELIQQYDTVSDNFKSYPSGHTAEASILMVPITFLPLADKKFEKIQLPLFIGAFCWMLFIAFARILAAAHYLSDISTGGTITLTLLLIANEVVIHIKALHPQEEVKEEPKEE
ncbi:MAG: phosphatase PAP2 family protein [Bacilli bacterium]|nr:phosphatase PAP2 family protein [Bacilli bacterium]